MFDFFFFTQVKKHLMDNRDQGLLLFNYPYTSLGSLNIYHAERDRDVKHKQFGSR